MFYSRFNAGRLVNQAGWSLSNLSLMRLHLISYFEGEGQH